MTINGGAETPWDRAARERREQEEAARRAAQRRSSIGPASSSPGRRDGMRVRLSRIPGITHPKLLRTPLFFQCPPTDSIERAKGHSSTTYSVYRKGGSGGEFVTIGGRRLRRISFSTLFVDGRPVFAVAPNQHRNELARMTMERLVRALEELSESGTPFRFLATHQYGRTPWANLAAHLPDINVAEREPDALYVDNLVFEEWRSSTAGSRGRAGGKSWPKTHRLTRRDTLYSLARRYYGREGAGREGARTIASANNIKQWGFDTPITDSKRYRVRDKIKIPQPRLSKSKKNG